MKLALGTVQFGLAYGVANAVGQVPCDEASRILTCASEAGIDTLDTAAAYGKAERVLGEIGVGGWQIVTKVPALPRGVNDTRTWVVAVVTRSLANLGVSQVNAVLLHCTQDLLGPNGAALWAGLCDARDAGLCARIGISIYRSGILDLLPDYVQLELVQAPFNVFDRELETSGWADRLSDVGTAIHLRSTFLQGLLLMSPEARAERFQGNFAELVAWDAFLAATCQDALRTALGYVLERTWAERVIVGVDSASQISEILAAAKSTHISPPDTLASRNPKLIDPSQWRRPV